MKTRAEYNILDFLKDDSFLRSVLLLTDDDVEFWDNYVLENPEKKQEIEAAKQLLSSMTFDDETYYEQEKLELLEHVNDQVKSIRRHRLYVGFYKIFAVACVVALLSVGVYSFFAPFTSDNQVATIEKNRSNFEKDTRLVIAGERTIPLEEGDDVLYGGGEATISSINQQDERYAVDVNDSKIEYNELIVPKGRRASHLVLEDGSKVWVNSGSTFRFPTTFEKNKREVYVDGEIYIEIAKDAERPFFVKTSEMSVRALGTRFNVMAYHDELAQSVVLVEGLVEVQSNDESKKKILQPDHMLTLASNSMDITAANTYDFISWKDGLLQFRSQPLSMILAKISRHYDLYIDCEKDIKDLKCSGKLVLFDDPKDVLETISRTISLEKADSKTVPMSYEMNGNTILLKKRS